VRAAELRAVGNRWEATARAIRRSARAVRRWPILYPDEWNAALADAHRRAVGDLFGESLHILRELLRAKDDKLRGGAAATLTSLRIKQALLDLRTGKPPALVSPLVAEIARIVENCSDDDIYQLLAVLRSLRAQSDRGVRALPPPAEG
jgi:hypothetical protein